MSQPIYDVSAPIGEEENYSQAVVDKQMRRTIVNICKLNYHQLQALTPEDMQACSAFEAMWVNIMKKASATKPDMRAAEFIQEHLAGKAIQRVESHTTTVTYQDLLKKVKKDEERYQNVITVQATHVITENPNWEDLK